MNKIKNFFKRTNNNNNNINKNIKESNSSHIKMNIKGQQVNYDNFNPYASKFSYEQTGPQMFNTKTRIKIWGCFFLFTVYVYLVYRLMLYRLKADDLDLMEREVKKDYEIRRKINELDN